MPLRLLGAVAGAHFLLLAGAAAAEARTVWLCKPSLKGDPCRGELTATRLAPDGQTLPGLKRARAPRRPKVDCFYVYPTVSSQPTTNATRAKDPPVVSVARWQAQPFSELCRVFAPVYRQLTLTGIRSPGAGQGLQIAYRDVRAAFREYLRRDNGGRGIVFVSHSQGTYILRRLLRDEVDRRPAVRRRLVSGVLAGGDVQVRRGSTVGGDFQRIPLCRRRDQTGCVMAWSLYGRDIPPNAAFGRTSDPNREVACVHPGSPAGGNASMRSYVRTDGLPGATDEASEEAVSELPAARTPWTVLLGHYTGQCVRTGTGVHVVQVTPVEGARELQETAPGWGLHTADLNLPLGNALDTLRRQMRTYENRR